MGFSFNMSVQKYQFCPNVVHDADLTWQHSIKPMSFSSPDGSLTIPLNDVFVGFLTDCEGSLHLWENSMSGIVGKKVKQQQNFITGHITPFSWFFKCHPFHHHHHQQQQNFKSSILKTFEFSKGMPLKYLVLFDISLGRARTHLWNHAC